MESTTMVDPLLALAVFAAIVSALCLLLWPRWGLVSRLSQMRRMTDQVLLEDALKHLYKCEYEAIAGTVESVAGALSITRGRAVKLLVRLQEMALARAEGAGFTLSDGGRAYALRILRTHRLWERYLADRTGVRPEEWHEEAEQREHTLSPSDAEMLSASLGHPRYDPHGDPIPTATGEIPPKQGIPLPALARGETAIISHLEDEPREVYQRLLEERLTPMTRVKLIAVTESSVRFRTDQGMHELPPAVASNITVEPAKLEIPRPESFRTLADVGPGEQAVVIGISPALQGAQRRRLLDLGIIPGTTIRAELTAATGGATAYRIRDALIALRREQAARIQVDLPRSA